MNKGSARRALSKREARVHHLEIEVVRKVLEDLDTPVSLGVYLRIKYAEEDPSLWLEIAKASIRADDYLTASSFADDYLAVEMLRKSPSLPIKVDRAAAALNKWLESEEINRANNARLHELARTGMMPGWFPRFRRHVHKLFGQLDEERLNSIVDRCHYGPGVTVGLDTSMGNRMTEKYRQTLTCTRRLMPFVATLYSPEVVSYQGLREVDYETWSSVPKNAMTNRSIAPQPSVNGFLQLGIGEEIARGLLQFGFDIRDQSWNQLLASRAHALGFATLDLTDASGRICRELVRQAVPPRWFYLLNLARCDKIVLSKGTPPIALESFSAMGNGFTFPLQTLLFAAVVRTFVPPSSWCVCAVYGDDIIVPSDCYDAVVEGLQFLGLEVNTRKSYRGGSFFESCGTDYFLGRNVRPIYLDKDASRESGIPYALQIANALRSYAFRRGIFRCCDGRFRKTWEWLYHQIPPLWRLPVPPSMGDTGLLTERPETPVLDRSTGWIRVRHIDVSSRVKLIQDQATVNCCIATMRFDRDPGALDWAQAELFQSLEQVTPAAHGVLADVQPFADSVRGLYGRPRVRVTTIQRWDAGWEWM